MEYGGFLLYLFRNMNKQQTIVFLHVLSVVLLGVGLISCDIISGSNDDHDFPVTIQAVRTFNAQNIKNYSWYSLTADLRYTGSHCLVYVDQTVPSSLSDAMVNEIGQEFDNKVYSIIHTYFGTEYDVDGNGKVILLLLDIQDGYVEGSGGYVAGYFDSTHMYSKETVPNSNEADMLFMDMYPGLLDAAGALDQIAYDSLKVTLAHEFQHLVSFSERVARMPTPKPQDTWINEGLSSAAEYLYLGSHIQWKIDYFNQKGEPGNLVTGYDPLNDANLWGQFFVSWGVWGDTLVNYATVYLFFQWLRIQGGGPDIYRPILIDSAIDAGAVVTAFSNNTGESCTWKDLFRTWLFANLLNNSTGWYGYKDQLNDGEGNVRYLYPRYFTSLDTNEMYDRGSPPPFDANGKAQLIAGDAVYVKLASALPIDDSPQLAYGSATLPAGAPKVGGSYAANEVLIAGNILKAADYYVYSTEVALLNPIGPTGVEINSSLLPPAGSWIPKAKSFSSKGTVSGRGGPYPIDALLGPSQPSETEARIPGVIQASR